MASIESYETAAGRRWMVRYRTPERTTTKRRGFERRRDAEAFLHSIEVAKSRGEFVAASAGRVTVGELAKRWRENQVAKPATLAANASSLEVHILPKWGKVYAADVAHTDVKAWVSSLSATRGPATVRRAHNVLSMILADAVRDGRLARNPAEGVPLPRKIPKPRVYLSHAQVRSLAAAAGDFGPVVWTLAYTGLRWGELAALKAGRVDMLRRRLEVVENVVDVGGRLTWGTPKTHESRSVPFPEFLAPVLAGALAGKGPDDLVFTGGRGGVLRHNSERRRHFDPAVEVAGRAVVELQAAVRIPASARDGVFGEATGAAVSAWQGRHGVPVTGRGDSATWRALAASWEVPELERFAVVDVGPGSRDFGRLTPHDLRHTAASLAVSAGANVKAVQRMLGHASAAMTLDTYADLFDDGLDAVATRLNDQMPLVALPSGPQTRYARPQ